MRVVRGVHLVVVLFICVLAAGCSSSSPSTGTGKSSTPSATPEPTYLWATVRLVTATKSEEGLKEGEFSKFTCAAGFKPVELVVNGVSTVSGTKITAGVRKGELSISFTDGPNPFYGLLINDGIGVSMPADVRAPRITSGTVYVDLGDIPGGKIHKLSGCIVAK